MKNQSNIFFGKKTDACLLSVNYDDLKKKGGDKLNMQKLNKSNQNNNPTRNTILVVAFKAIVLEFFSLKG